MHISAIFSSVIRNSNPLWWIHNKTKSTTDLQNSETTLSTNGSKTIKLTTDNKTTSLENFPKSSQTGVNSMTPVVGDDPRAEALTNLSGLMSIVSSNPYKRFTQKANKKNTVVLQVSSSHASFVWRVKSIVFFFKHCCIWSINDRNENVFFIVFVKFFFGTFFTLIVKLSIKVKIIFADTCYTYMYLMLTCLLVASFLIKETVQVFLTKYVVVYYEVDDSIHKWVVFVLILSVHVFYLEHLLLIDSKSGVNNIIIN